MIELGKTQCLNVVKIVDFGIYLGTEEDKVLLPKKQVPQDIEVGDALTVFVYRDSSDRLIATTKTPKLELGKDLFLPFKEQTTHVEKGDICLTALYVDKSNRLAATMRVYDYLSCDSPYVKDSAVQGTVIEINPDYGVYVAVDDRYFGMIPKNEVFGKIQIGDTIHGRVSKVRDDHKLSISLKQKAYIQMDEDSSIIYHAIEKRGGSLPFTDKAAPEIIKAEFDMSKNAFKRAVGRLLKEGKIEIAESCIKLKK